MINLNTNYYEKETDDNRSAAVCHGRVIRGK